MPRRSISVSGIVSRLGFSCILAFAAAGTMSSPASAAQAAAQPAARALRFETYSDAKRETRWRLKAGNGQTIATAGQGYRDKRDCKSAIDRIKKDARALKFETYDDAKGETRWRLKATNGQIIAVSAEGYKDKRDCETAIKLIKDGAQGAKVEES